MDIYKSTTSFCFFHLPCLIFLCARDTFYNLPCLIWIHYNQHSISQQYSIEKVFTINCKQRFKTKKEMKRNNCNLLKNKKHVLFTLSIVIRNGKTYDYVLSFYYMSPFLEFSATNKSFHYHGQSWYFPTTFSMHFNFLHCE